jgi:prepilin peptidase CpaA
MSTEIIGQIIISIVVLIAVVIDVRTTKIPNLLTFPAALIGLILGFVQGGMHGALNSLLGWLIGAVIVVFFSYLPIGPAGEKLGMGDAKLLAAVGAFVGPTTILVVFFYFCLSFGVISAVLLLRAIPWKQVGGIVRAIIFGAEPDTSNLDTEKLKEARKKRIPASAAIAMGAVLGQLYAQPTLHFLGF